MSQENVELVERTYERINDAYKTGEYQGPMEELCHPDVVLSTSGMFPESGEYRGFDGLREFTINQAEAFEEISAQPVEFIDAGDQVVVPLRFGGKARHSGIKAAFSVVHVWSVREGKISRLDMFQSRAEALNAVGLAE
jgi:ketosteroid isomerase-like protein